MNRFFKGMVERFDRERDWLEISEDYAKVKTDLFSKTYLVSIPLLKMILIFR